MMIHGQNAKARGKMKIYGIFSNVCRYKKEKMSDCGRWNGCTAQSAGTAGFWSGRCGDSTGGHFQNPAVPALCAVQPFHRPQSDIFSFLYLQTLENMP